MPQSNAWKILLIDDEADICEITALALTDAGYTVRTAGNGENGLEICDTFLPQIVITDIRMPGIDGLKVLETVKDRHPQTEVIVATAYAEIDLAVRALQLDASDFITKPINNDALMIALDRAKQRFATKQQLQEVIHRDKMLSLGRLAASVAHEVNNPLSGILNYIRLMMRIIKRGDLAGGHVEKFTRYLEVIEKETDRCARIVSNLLLFSRKSPVTYEMLDLTEVIQRSIVLSRHKMGLCNIELVTAFENNVPAIRGDANQLQQCFINLIFNAVDAMPDGGKLVMRLRHLREPSLVVFSIEDTGPGIDAADLPHIFEPFFTTKPQGQGLGLGLSTTYGIIERHKGTIEASSRPGEGACFEIRLPC